MIKKLMMVLAFLCLSLPTFADTKSELSAVMKNYETLHSAFFTYDGGKVELAANELSKTILKISDQKIKKKLEFALKQLTEIKVSNDRKNNNDYFHSVSLALMHVLKAHGGDNKYHGYTCPMVKKKWIQNTEKNSRVMNPYAPEMPHCGEQI